MVSVHTFQCIAEGDDNGEEAHKHHHEDLGCETKAEPDGEQMFLGMLAYSAGILPEIRPTTLEKLLPVFAWDKVKKEDILTKTS